MAHGNRPKQGLKKAEKQSFNLSAAESNAVNLRTSQSNFHSGSQTSTKSVSVDVLFRDTAPEYPASFTEDIEGVDAVTHKDMLENLRDCIKALVARPGGVESVQLSHENMLKYLAEIFIKNENEKMQITKEEFVKILEEERAVALNLPCPGAQYTITINRAFNLLAKDTDGTSDPYCMVGIVPKTTSKIHKYGPLKFQRTKSVQKNLNPMWDETFTFECFDVWGSKILIDCFDDDQYFISGHSRIEPGGDDFLGRISIPLSTVGRNSERIVEVLARSSKSQVNGAISIQITSQLIPTAIAGQAIEYTKKHILQLQQIHSLCIQRESEKISDETIELCTSFIQCNCLDPVLANAWMFINQAMQLGKKRKTDMAMMAKTIEVVARAVDFRMLPQKDLDILYSAMNMVRTYFSWLLVRINDSFPFNDEESHNRLYHWCDVVGLIIVVPGYKDKCSNLGTLQNEVGESIKKNALRCVAVAKEASKENFKNDPVAQLEYRISVHLDTLDKAKTNLSAALKQIGIKYLTIHTVQYLKVLMDELKPTIDSVPVESAYGDVNPRIFRLYFQVKHFIAAYARKLVPIEELEAIGILSYHEWFTRFVVEWLHCTKRMAENWILMAIEVDDKDALLTEEVYYSSSVIDVFASFSQALSFIVNLEWEDPSTNLAFIIMFFEMVCEGLTVYAEKMRKTFEQQGHDDKQFVTVQHCIHLNNIDIAVEKMRATFEAIDLNSLMVNLREKEGCSFTPPLVVFFDEQAMFVREQLYFCLDYLANKIEPLIVRYLSRLCGVEKKPILKVLENFFVGNLLEDEDAPLEILKENSEKIKSTTIITEELVTELMIDLTGFLDTILGTLDEYLITHELFINILERLWLRTVSAMWCVIKPNNNRFPINYQKSKILWFAMTILRNYFHADGDGVRVEKVDCDEFLKLKEILEYMDLNTPELISRFYIDQEELQAKANNMNSTDEEIVDEIDDDLGKFEAEITYNSKTGKVEVLLICCYGLPAMDKTGFSDPYIVMSLLPERLLSKRQKSRVIMQTLNPVFNEKMEVTIQPPVDDILLKFEFYDYDYIGGDDYMGEITIPISGLPHNTPYRNVWPLTIPRAGGAVAQRYGKADISLSHNRNFRSVDIILHNAKNLLPMDTTGLTDCYVTATLLPASRRDPHHGFYKTKTVMETLNPEFEEAWCIKYTRPSSIEAREPLLLKLTFWDYDQFDPDDFIAELLIDLKRLSEHRIRQEFGLSRAAGTTTSKYIYYILNDRALNLNYFFKGKRDYSAKAFVDNIAATLGQEFIFG
eukprot:CFRG0404T1